MATEELQPSRKLSSRVWEALIWAIVALVLIPLASAAAAVALGNWGAVAVCAALTLLGVIFLALPNRRFGRARAGLLAAICVCWLLPFAFYASLSPEQLAAAEAEVERQRQERAVEQEARQAAEAAQAQRNRQQQDQVAAEPASTAPQPTPAPSGPSAEAQAAFEATHRRFMALANRCDAAWSAMTDAAGSTDIYAAYTAADRGSDICRDVWLAMDSMEFSDSIERDTRRELDHAVNECGTAMWERHNAMDRAARMFDGNMRPSTLAEFREHAASAQQRTIECMIHYLQAATDGGYEIPAPESGAE